MPRFCTTWTVLLLTCGVSTNGIAQSLQRSVMQPGRSADAGAVRVHWTFGQVETRSSTAGTLRLTRGYEQAYRDRRTVALLRTTDCEGRAGDTVESLLLIEGLPLSTAGVLPDSLLVRIAVNVTLLATVAVRGSGVLLADDIGDTLRRLTLRVPIGPGQTDRTLATMRFVAGLGDDSTSRIAIENVVFVGSKIPLLQKHGLFRLLDLCMEGGPRLIDPRRTTAVGNVAPNPVAVNASIDLALTEPQFVAIEIYDARGAHRQHVAVGYLEQGTYTVHLPVDALVTGVYALVVSIGSTSETRTMVIQR